MSLKITNTHNDSTSSKEFIELEVTEDISLKNYAIVDQTFDQKKISNTFRHIYEFPNTNVSKGDKIMLFSGKGKNVFVEKGDHKTFTLYWNSDECIWNNTGDIAILISYKDIGRETVASI